MADPHSASEFAIAISWKSLSIVQIVLSELRYFAILYLNSITNPIESYSQSLSGQVTENALKSQSLSVAV